MQEKDVNTRDEYDFSDAKANPYAVHIRTSSICIWCNAPGNIRSSNSSERGRSPTSDRPNRGSSPAIWHWRSDPVELAPSASFAAVQQSASSAAHAHVDQPSGQGIIGTRRTCPPPSHAPRASTERNSYREMLETRYELQPFSAPS